MEFPTTIPVLETPRLVLRDFADRDVAPLFAMHADPEVARYTASPPMTDVAQVHAWLERHRKAFAQREALRWAVARVGDDVAIGTCLLFGVSHQCRRAEIGYMLGREHWGRGYMHEALTAVLDWSFDVLGLHRVEADVDPRNAASVRAAERLGFVREGLLRERWWVADEVSDSMMLGLLRREWLERRAPRAG